MFGIDFVLAKGAVVRTLVDGFVVSTKAPQLTSFDDVWVNGWSRNESISMNSFIHSFQIDLPEKKLLVDDILLFVVVVVVVDGGVCKISKSAKQDNDKMTWFCSHSKYFTRWCCIWCCCCGYRRVEY